MGAVQRKEGIGSLNLAVKLPHSVFFIRHVNQVIDLSFFNEVAVTLWSSVAQR